MCFGPYVVVRSTKKTSSVGECVKLFPYSEFFFLPQFSLDGHLHVGVIMVEIKSLNRAVSCCINIELMTHIKQTVTTSGLDTEVSRKRKAFPFIRPFFPFVSHFFASTTLTSITLFVCRPKELTEGSIMLLGWCFDETHTKWMEDESGGKTMRKLLGKL